MKKIAKLLAILVITASCASTKTTIKNIDNNAPGLTVNASNTFVITEYSTDKKYGYEQDYPINIFYRSANEDVNNQLRFLNALAGPKGQKITYTKLESCCPFPTTRTELGAGLLDVYELKWEGQRQPIQLYLNSYEKGRVMVPVGLSLKK